MGLESIQNKFRNRNAWVDILAICFGIGAWVAVNGLWVELPLLVVELPEGWDLGSYMTLITQMANIGPLLYTLVRFLRPSLRPALVIYFVLFIGCVSSFLLIFVWDETSTVNGEEHSTALLTMVFFLALVDCTSSVLYFPYMSVWKEIYFSSYLIGEGLSGFLPATFSLFQGSGGEIQCTNVSYTNDSGYEIWTLQQEPLDPHFSIEWFFFFIFCMMLLSATAFILLQFLPFIKSERSESEDGSLKSSRKVQKAVQDAKEQENMISRRTFWLLLCLQVWACFLANGFMPSIQAYSCGPYGNIAYHWAVTLSTMANPTAAFITMFMPRMRTLFIYLLAALASAIAGYLIALAVMSPTPILVDYWTGAALMIIGWILFTGFITYVRAEISLHLREESSQSLFWSGFATQVGSLIGSLVAFYLVNNTTIFSYYDACAS